MGGPSFIGTAFRSCELTEAPDSAKLANSSEYTKYRFSVFCMMILLLYWHEAFFGISCIYEWPRLRKRNGDFFGPRARLSADVSQSPRRGNSRGPLSVQLSPASRAPALDALEIRLTFQIAAGLAFRQSNQDKLCPKKDTSCNYSRSQKSPS